MKVEQFHSGGMYTHNKIAGAYLKVKTVLWMDEALSFEITFDVHDEKTDAIKVQNQAMLIHVNDLYKWSQRGVC